MMQSRKKYLFGSLLFVVLVASGLGYWQKTELTAIYDAWKLQKATPDLLPAYVRQFESLGLTGTAALVKLFQSENEMTCRNAGQVLTKILQIWPSSDERRDAALQQLANSANYYSSAGQTQCLKMIQQLVSESESSVAMGQVIARLATQANSDVETRLALYDVLTSVLNNEQNVPEKLAQQAKGCVLAGVADKNVPVRLAAIRLGVSPSLQLHEHLLSLLTGANVDSSPEVRQLLLLAFGEHEKLLSTDELCKFLQDGDAEVRAVAERALRVRGLTQNQLKLAKMVHDSNPSIRAELPALVLATPEVDSFLWLERLSRDSDPAVRAASARAMGRQGDERLNSLLQQLSEQDKDPTVRQLARFYWKQ